MRLCTTRLCILLRLSVLLHRGRSASNKPMAILDTDEDKLRLNFPEGWLERHPLTRAELAAEAVRLRSIEFELTFH